MAKDPSIYDLIIVGTPVWAWSVSSPVRAYLLANKPRLPSVAFFCTLGGAGADRAFGQMQELAGKRPIGCLSLTARRGIGWERNTDSNVCGRLATESGRSARKNGGKRGLNGGTCVSRRRA